MWDAEPRADPDADLWGCPKAGLFPTRLLREQSFAAPTPLLPCYTATHTVIRRSLERKGGSCNGFREIFIRGAGLSVPTPRGVRAIPPKRGHLHARKRPVFSKTRRLDLPAVRSGRDRVGSKRGVRPFMVAVAKMGCGVISVLGRT